MQNKDWIFSHNFTDAGAMLQSAYYNRLDSTLQLNVLDNRGNAFLFKDGVFVCQIPMASLKLRG